MDFAAQSNVHLSAGFDSLALGQSASEAESLLRSLASRHRLMILWALLEGEAAVGTLVERLGLSQSNLSRHLAALRRMELVATRCEGTVIHYRIASARVQPILAALHSLFCPAHS